MSKKQWLDDYNFDKVNGEKAKSISPIENPEDTIFVSDSYTFPRWLKILSYMNDNSQDCLFYLFEEFGEEMENMEFSIETERSYNSIKFFYPDKSMRHCCGLDQSFFNDMEAFASLEINTTSTIEKEADKPLLTKHEEIAVACYNVNHYNFSEIGFNWLGFYYSDNWEVEKVNRKKAILVYCSGMEKLGHDVHPKDYELNSSWLSFVSK